MVQREVKAKKIYDYKSAKAKAEYYCAYQERSQYEVRTKLYEMGLHSRDVELIISELIDTNFLNEERFAIHYAGGKFRIKHWGKQKIEQALKLKKVSPYCIHKALQQIDDETYASTISALIQKKAIELKTVPNPKKNYKIAQYLISRGFEAEQIWDQIHKAEKLIS